MKSIELEKENPLEITHKISGAQAVVKAIINEGADLIFGYPGGAIMPVYDALYDVEDELSHDE